MLSKLASKTFRSSLLMQPTRMAAFSTVRAQQPFLDLEEKYVC